jgi:hypothetical protein
MVTIHWVILWIMISFAFVAGFVLAALIATPPGEGAVVTCVIASLRAWFEAIAGALFGPGSHSRDRVEP